MYSEKVLDHFKNPRNSGILVDADAVSEVGTYECGDVVKIYIKVKNDVLDKVQFQAFGCAAAIATSSMTTVLAKGKTLKEAMELTKNDIVDALDGLPPIKQYCSNLAVDGLHEAIRKYTHSVNSES